MTPTDTVIYALFIAAGLLTHSLVIAILAALIVIAIAVIVAVWRHRRATKRNGPPRPNPR